MIPDPGPILNAVMRGHEAKMLPDGLVPVRRVPYAAEGMILERRLALYRALEILDEQSIEVESEDKSERCFFIREEKIDQEDSQLVDEAQQLNMALSFFWHTKLGECRDFHGDHEGKGSVFTVMPGRLVGSVLETLDKVCNKQGGAS